MMGNMYSDVTKLLDNANKAFDSELYDASANAMRQIAEVLAPFYIHHYKLDTQHKRTIDEEKSKGHKGNILLCLYTLRRTTSIYNDSFLGDLIIFLSQARKIGNDASHATVSIERWEAEYLIRFFEKHILEQFGANCGAKAGATSKLKDVTKDFHGKGIFIFSCIAEKYVSAMIDTDMSPVTCVTNNKDAWESFDVEVDRNGFASFKACNGRYLSVNLDEDETYPPVRAIGPRSSDWEKFKIFKYNNRYALKAQCNGMWVTCRIDWEDAPLYAACESVDAWEEFKIETKNM